MSAGLGPWLLGLALALEPAGLWAQWRLEEAGGGHRAPGDSVLLSCRGSGFNFGLYVVHWYRQAPGGRPEWVSSISTDSSWNRPAFLPDAFWGDEIQPTRSAVWWPAGITGTLQCTYSSNASYIYVAWYQQCPGGPLQYLLQCQGCGGSYSHTAPFAHRRFSCQADKSSGTLSITGLEQGDSASYYCSLEAPQREAPGGASTTSASSPAASPPACSGGTQALQGGSQ
ncbi:PREDICTED: uncharacterized protein LOC108509802 [Lepidothrix coronata]|uniref:Uncharacterized protein LOC108509802 n=1 Tax=Lepidothrix coronata TaxID=321398 RepID=A0A6J0J997_9PASS|nr:PREDICTED: uncharacterized protein LOC108509802 [Lepidothrix coronata]